MKMDANAFVADPELIEALKKHATRVECEEDRLLFKQGDAPEGLYLFCGGQATLSLTSSAGDVVMSVSVDVGSLLGLPGVIGNVPYSLTARAKKGSLVTFVKREDFHQLMLTDPSVSVGILRVLAAEVRTARMALVER
ncbi:MAG TPA: cyclic nucleotide-binding domain-containing protein [Terracidiphilus sp.]|jgi:CRP-like cAMP-binding protein